MNIVDIIILILFILYIAKGFSNGVLKELVTFVGGFAVIVLAFILKNPISEYMYQNLPFFKFSGIFSGISVLNIIIYEIIAFLLVAAVIMIIYQLIIKVTNILETILKITFILEIPSKILGAVVGFVEGAVVVFVLLFICMQFELTRNYIVESKFGDPILSEMPIMSSAIKPIYSSLKEIYDVAENYKDATDRDQANLESLDILLKYNVLDAKSAQVLVDNDKLNMPGIEDVIAKYDK